MQQLPSRAGRCFFVVLAVLLVAPKPGTAQLDRRIDVTLRGGSGIELPRSFYNGWIDLTLPRPGDTLAPAHVRTRYRERAEAHVSWWGALRTELDGRYFVEIRGRMASAASTGELSGATAPITSDPADVEWSSFGLGAGLRLWGGDLWRLNLFVGREVASWTLGPAERRQPTVLDPRTHEPLPLLLPRRAAAAESDGWELETELQIRASERLTLSATAAIHPMRTDFDRLAATHTAALRGQGVDLATVSYDEHTEIPATLAAGLSYRIGRIDLKDPAPEALARAALMSPSTTPGGLTAAADAALANADTAAAIAALREAIDRGGDTPAALGALGRLLAVVAPAEEAAFQQRTEAERVLERAIRADPAEPANWVALGALMLKQGREQDARRVLTRGISAASAHPERSSPSLLAEAFYLRGTALEVRVSEFEELRWLGLEEPPINTPDCMGGGAFCLNFTRPRPFYEWMAGLATLDHHVAEERSAMVREFERAVELAPAHRGANRALLRLHARAGDWIAFRERAAAWAAADPEGAWAAMMLGAALMRSGDLEAAAPAFRRGLAGLPPSDLAVFEDLSPLLRTDTEEALQGLPPEDRARLRRAYWALGDPLYLTEGNERRLEHYARVALAELLFGEPSTGRRGWATDRGQILVRYGVPRETWQVAQGGSEVLAGILNPTAQAGGVPGAGRWIFWNYAPDRPSFIFSKRLGFASVRHMPESSSAAYQEDLKATQPAAYDPPFASEPMPHQVARFRLPDGRWAVEVHGKVPEPLNDEGVPVRRGLFVVHRESGVRVAEYRPDEAVEGREPTAERREAPDAAADADELSARLVLPAGSYQYSVEAVSAGVRQAAVGRADLDLAAPSRSAGLELSDLLVASWVEPLSPAPTARVDLDVRPLRCMRIPEERVVAIAFEVYGLAQEEGMGSYRVEVRTTGQEERNALLRLLDRTFGILPAPDREGLTFERTAPVVDGRTVDWFELELASPLPDELSVEVVVTDLSSGENASARRSLPRDRCGPGVP